MIVSTALTRDIAWLFSHSSAVVSTHCVIDSPVTTAPQLSVALIALGKGGGCDRAMLTHPLLLISVSALWG